MKNNGLSDNGQHIRKWDDWAIWVLKTIEDNSNDIKDMGKTLEKMNTRFVIMETRVKIRAGFIGAIMAILFSGLINLIVFLVAT